LFLTIEYKDSEFIQIAKFRKKYFFAFGEFFLTNTKKYPFFVWHLAYLPVVCWHNGKKNPA
jgi:hypothetical protein